MNIFTLKYYGYSLLTKIVVYVPPLIALYFLITDFNLLFGFILILSLAYSATYGGDLDDFFRKKMIYLETEQVRGFLRSGNVEDSTKFIDFLIWRANSTFPVYKYYKSFRYIAYNIATLVDPDFNTFEEYLINYGNKNLLSNEIYLFFEFYQSIFLRYIINNEFEKGYNILYQILMISANTELDDSESIERFRTYASYPGLIVGFSFGSIVINREKAQYLHPLKINHDKFIKYLKYIENPTDDNLEILIKYYDRLYEVRQVMAYAALYEIAKQKNIQTHCDRLSRLLSDSSSNLWVVKKFKYI